MAVMPFASALASTITIQVGDNFYKGPDGSNTIRMKTDDVLIFQYIGFQSHPTQSDSAPVAWATFQMNSANTTKQFNSGAFATGTYPFHCQAHGAPGIGQFGTLIVSNPTPTLDARAAGIEVNVFPNPSRGQITVQFNQKTSADLKLRLSNIIGQDIRTIALKPELMTAGLPVDLSDLHAGLYFYSLLVDGKVVTTKRLVLQN